MKRSLALVSLSLTLGLAGCGASNTKPPASTEPAARTAAVDLHNTVCPVSNDPVETSKLTQTYDGKVYHLCCADCSKPFKNDPGKYAKAVDADPAKYGVKADAGGSK
jgi:YHS domain-containing protein